MLLYKSALFCRSWRGLQSLISEGPIFWQYISLKSFPTILAGSKIKVTSMIHMSWELLAVQLGYTLTGIWKIQGQNSASKKVA